MKKILTFLLLLSVVFLQAQNLDVKRWNTPYYDITYSQKYEQPLTIHYMVCGTDGTASRTGLNFHTEKSIHTSDDKDYVNNEWDKGHMAPAASLNCSKDMMYESFSYVNCALQQERLNRGVWRFLEDRERKLSTWANINADIYIIVDFDSNPRKVPGGASIPKGFYKEILVGDIRECYWFKNEVPKSDDPADYECPCRN